MKNIITILLSIVFYNSYSQDCSQIKRDSDEMEEKISLLSPNDYGVSIMKVITKSSIVYYLSLETSGYTLNIGEKGVIVLFTDGTKWQKPSEKIDAEYYKGERWKYSAFMRLMPDDIMMFTQKKVKKFRLYIYDCEIPEEGALEFNSYMECIQKMK